MATCIDSTYSWTFNSLNQSPCVVGAYLASACTGNPPIVNSQLPPTWHYDGPLVSTATPCKCSTVYYSVISACAICQEGEYLTWSQWNTNCSNVYPNFPAPVPAGTRVPHWAYLPIGAGDLWSIPAAQAAVSGPESTGGSTGQTSITQVAGGTTVYTTGGAIPTINNGSFGGGGTKKTNVGAIAGGVVGGVVALAIIAILAILLLRRRNANRTAPSSLINTSQLHGTSPAPTSFLGKPTPLVGDPSPQQVQLGYHNTGSTMAPSFPVPSATSAPPLRLYDPSDPTTFPAPMGMVPPMNGSSPSVVPSSDPILRPLSRLNNAHDAAPGVGYARGYNGGPEV